MVPHKGEQQQLRFKLGVQAFNKSDMQLPLGDMAGVTAPPLWCITRGHLPKTASLYCFTNLLSCSSTNSKAALRSQGSASHGNLHLKRIPCQLALQLISILIDCNVFSHLHLFIKETFSSDPSHSRHLSPSLLCFMCWQCATTGKQEDTGVISPPQKYV